MKTLIVVDYQVDFVSGSLGFPGAEKLEPVIIGKIEQCRRDGGQVIFTLDTHTEDYLSTAEGKKLPVVHCVKGTHGHEIYGGVAAEVRPEDIVIEKPAFGSLQLADLLRRLNPGEVELCGLVTDICVISNAVIAKAALPESRIVVDPRACASADPQAHSRALAVMSGVQIDIL